MVASHDGGSLQSPDYPIKLVSDDWTGCDSIQTSMWDICGITSATLLEWAVQTILHICIVQWTMIMFNESFFGLNLGFRI